MTSPRPAGGSPRTSSARARTHRTGVIRAGNLRTVETETGPQPRPSRSLPTRPDLWLVPAEPARGQRTAARGRRRAPFVLLVVGLLVGTTIGLLVLNTAVAVDSLKATQLRTENAQRLEDVQRLERQVVDGRTPDRLAREAAAAGLVPAGPPAYLVIEGDGSSTVRGAPGPSGGADAGGTGGDDATGTGDDDATSSTGDHTTGDDGTGDATGDDGAGGDTASSDTASSDTASDDATGSHTAGDGTGSDGTGSDDTGSDDTESDGN